MHVKLTDIEPPATPLRAAMDEDALQDLANSMATLGQLQPIGLKPGTVAKYQIVFGHRRFCAAQLLNWPKIEAVQRETHTEEHNAFAMLVENTQREGLTPFEEAYALYSAMEKHKLTPAQLARQAGKSVAWVKARLGILDWPEDCQAALHAGRISQGVAAALATIADDAMREHYLNAAIQSGATAEMASVWCQAANLAAAGIAAAARTEEGMAELQREPAHVDQQYTCFCCANTDTWRRFNLLCVCAKCQEQIAALREKGGDRS